MLSKAKEDCKRNAAFGKERICDAVVDRFFQVVSFICIIQITEFIAAKCKLEHFS